MAREDPAIFALSALEGCIVVGSDGRIGTVKDFLFVDDRWRVRWLVIDTGAWLPGRKVLIHPSAIADVDYALQQIATPLTRHEVMGGPDVRDGEVVSRDVETRLFTYYGWDPDWGAGLFAAASQDPPAAPGAVGKPVDDPHLRSFEATKRCRLRATDGEIGSVKNFLVDRAGWNIRYLIAATGSWLFGKEMLLAPYAVTATDWLNNEILLNVTRKQVENSPPWDPVEFIDEAYGSRLHQHYGWPAYGPYTKDEHRLGPSRIVA
jgi:hypothetical protein